MIEGSIGRKREIIFIVITGAIISFCYVAGYQLDNFETLNLTDVSLYLKLLVGTVLAGSIVFFLWSWVEKQRKKKPGIVTAQERLPFKLHFWQIALILFGCWIPTWLSIFPGAFAYDATMEWQQVRDWAITSHHPVLHVLVTGGLVEVFYALTGNYNLGISVYTCLQLLLMACIFAVAIGILKELGVRAGFLWFALVFFAFSPVVQLFNVSSTKDVVFSGAELLFFLYVVLFYCRREDFFKSKRRMAAFVIVTLCTMILRNNGLYIVIITLVVMCFDIRTYRKKFGLQLLMVVAVYGLYVGPFYSVLGVEAGGVEEMLSVPMQQLARVHRYDYDSVTAEDLEQLYKVLPKENLDSYKATVSDFVKKGFQRDGFEADKAGFFKLWVKWGVEHPLSYINSFLINTVDFWYPNAVVDGYKDPYGKNSFFDYRVDKPGKENVLLPGLHDFWEKVSLDKAIQKNPISFLFLSPGWYLILYLVMAMYFWCYRKREFWVPMLILLLNFLTVLLGPIALVRYVLIFYYAFPVLLSMFLTPEAFITAAKV